MGVNLNYDFDIAAVLIEIILMFFYYQRKNHGNQFSCKTEQSLEGFIRH